MKRLIFCFDGTWNELTSGKVTNVGLVAQSIASVGADGATQIVYYDEGVGSSDIDDSRVRRALERLGGGVFGHGLLGNLVEAYKFLVFNFEPDDQIFVFGFSRGAFSARSFVGLLHSAGILRRSHVEKAHQAVENYRDLDPESDADMETMRQFRYEYARETYVDEADHLWRCDVHAERYDPDACTRLRVEYLGVWDTVGSMGIPSQLGDFSDWVNEKYAFHDCKLTDFVRYARHAVAIDEERPNFAPTLWTNVEDMNRLAKQERDERPYEQQWFPGDHGSVGGGGGIRGLSDGALHWVLDGARARGLTIDTDEAGAIFELKPNVMAPLTNHDLDTKKSFFGALLDKLPGASREPGPLSIAEVSEVAKLRWAEDSSYRPETLFHVADELEAFASELANTQRGSSLGKGDERTFYTVQQGDNLGAIAHAQYGDADLHYALFLVNRPLLLHPDEIFPGQELTIPLKEKILEIHARHCAV